MMAVVPWTYSNPYVDRKTLRSQQFTFFGTYLEIQQQNDIEINVEKNTGLKLWDGGYLLASYIENNLNLKGKKCVELGAGCGLVSMVAWLAGADVTATDLPEIIPHTKNIITSNIDRITAENTDKKLSRINCETLNWNSPSSLEGIDLILGSDIVYHPDLTEPLIFTLNCLCSENTTILLSYKPRGLGEDIFFKKITDIGFSYFIIDKQFYPKDFMMSDYLIYNMQLKR